MTMDRIASPKVVSPEAPDAEGEHGRHVRLRYIIEAIVWVIGLIVLATSAFYLHAHPGPLPGELEFSRAVQSLQLWPWLIGFLNFVGLLNDIPESIAAVALWVIGLCVFRKFRQALFFALTVGVGNGINILIGDFVGRMRPSPRQIHVSSVLTFNSFPSGHTEHDVVYYGFLLYLSFTRPVREWRYYRLLLPLQIFAVIIILSIGFSRVYAGEHWLTDVLGGYLSGLLWLFLFIFIYRWASRKLVERHR
jgi:membrane-associated phospholipid phosphatase